MHTPSFSPAKSLLFCLLLAPSLVPALASADTLSEIYQQALQNDHQYKAAQASLEAGREAPILGRSQLLPQIAADADLAKSDTSVTDNMEPVPPRLKNSGNVNGTTKSLGISLRQPLFNLALWNNYKRSQSLGNLAEEQFKSAEQSLIIRTAKAYFEALKAVDNYNTAKAEEAALARQLEQTKQRFQVGLIAITEVHEAQAAYDSAKANLLINQGQVGIAAEALEVLTGNGYQGLSPLQPKFPVQNPIPEPRQDWVDFALSNNSKLKIAALQADAARFNAKSKQADHLPTVTGSLGRSQTWQTGDSTLPTSASDTDTESANTRIAINVHIPLFAGGYTTASSRQAKQEQYASEETKQQAQRDIVQATRSLHLGVVTGVASVKARQQSIISSQSALDATRAGYEVGTRDLVELLNAQQRVFLAQRNYSDALYTYVLNTLQLKEAAGLLNKADVDAVDSWLDKSKTVKFAL